MKERSPIPMPDKAPNGFHQRYRVKKIVKNPAYVPQPENSDISPTEWEKMMPKYLELPTDPNAEYFVLRVDKGGKDPNHIAACRKGVLAYARAIKLHLPQLAKELIERYGENINKENFWNRCMMNYAEATKQFCDWVDDWKKDNAEQMKRINFWDVSKHKFHDLPYRDQRIVLRNFFNNQYNCPIQDGELTEAEEMMQFITDVFSAKEATLQKNKKVCTNCGYTLHAEVSKGSWKCPDCQTINKVVGE